MRMDWGRSAGVDPDGPTLELPVVHLGSAVVGDPVVMLADGRIGRWRPGTTELRQVARVPDAECADAWGAGTGDVLTVRLRPAILGRLRKVPTWGFDVARVGSTSVHWRRRAWLDEVVMIDDDAIVALATYAKGIVCLDATTGRWRWRSALPATRVVGVVGESMWCAIGDELVAIDLATGAQTATLRIGLSSPTGTLDATGKLHVITQHYHRFDLANGARDELMVVPVPRWQGLIRQSMLGPIEDGRVVAGTDRGDIFLIDRGEVHHLRRGARDETVFDLAVVGGHIHALVASLAGPRGAVCDDSLEVFGAR